MRKLEIDKVTNTEETLKIFLNAMYNWLVKKWSISMKLENSSRRVEYIPKQTKSFEETEINYCQINFL